MRVRRRRSASTSAGKLAGVTAGLAPGFVQANLAILPKHNAYDFLLFCQRNPRPCPLIEVTDVGSPEPVGVAPGADLRTDVPKYRIYKDGVAADEVTHITPFWRDDLVAFLLGCSFTFAWALLDAGIPLPLPTRFPEEPILRRAAEAVLGNEVRSGVCATCPWETETVPPRKLGKIWAMARSSTTFEPGHAGMGGRPKGSKDKLPRGSVKQAWAELTQEEPELLKQALRRGLTGRQPIGYLELGAKLQKELGNGHEAGGQIQVLFVVGGEGRIDLEESRQAALKAQRNIWPGGESDDPGT